MTRARHGLLLGIVACAALGSGAQAQPIYRIVDANGKVTFSDKPPTPFEQGKVVATGSGASSDLPATVALPFELRQVTSKFPVTLYTTANCAPCDSGRKFLESRGVPFSERTVTTVEDGAALRRLTGDSSMPALSLGAQRLKGFSDTEWSLYLDAAGYPKTSVLPAGFKNPIPGPLVPPAPQTAARAQEGTDPETATVPAPAPSNSANPANPAGITF
ncbi:MAG: DUF4124 domain-containing protein [Rhodoferax sp.]|nr:DUF4124 domain-containing protein [Rhodoferax sp.]